MAIYNGIVDSGSDSDSAIGYNNVEPAADQMSVTQSCNHEMILQKSRKIVPAENWGIARLKFLSYTQNLNSHTAQLLYFITCLDDSAYQDHGDQSDYYHITFT